jgi:hypothetical protein
LGSSSRGCRRRLTDGVEAVIANVERVKRWAAWSGVVFTVQASMLEACPVGGPSNMVVVGAAANALLSMHQGTGAAVRSGLKGAAYG